MADELVPPAPESLPPSILPTAGQTSDTRLIARALRSGWDIPNQYRRPLIDRLLMIALNDDPKRAPVAAMRERISAIKALMAANAQELQVIQMALDEQRGKQDPAMAGAIAGAAAGATAAGMMAKLQNASAEQIAKLREAVAAIESGKLSAKRVEMLPTDTHQNGQQ